MFERFNADVLAGFFLVAHINMRGRVIADQHHGQSRRHVPATFQPFYFCLDLFLDFFGDGLAVYDSRHEWTP
jgi:hypothetical protein